MIKIKTTVLFVSVLTLTACSTTPTPTSSKVDAEITTMHKQAKAGKRLPLSIGKKLIKAQLKDPASARFGRSFPAPSGANEKGYQATCIYVNAKNSYGGYGGEKLSIISYDINGKPFADIDVDPAVAKVICGV